MRAIRCDRFGGPEVLSLTDVPDPEPGPGQLLVDVSAAGVNYADTYRTLGTYSGGQTLPFIPGTEVVGRTTGGRRVAALTFAGGGYAERAVVSTVDAVDVPDAVADGAALALLVQGLTAWHLLHGSAALRPGETVVVNAAAGGVGTLAVQLARHLGAGRIIAAASSPAKRDLAVSLGADTAVDSDPGGYPARVLAANGGAPVDVVLESTGGPAFTAALEVLAPLGRLVTYGDSSRLGRPPVDPSLLADRSVAVAGFWLRPVLTRPDAFAGPLGQLLGLTASGVLRPQVGPAYPLQDARRAHEDLLARRTTGKLVLTVDRPRS
ncbi:zinc-binding dehydrogenase [Dactylosporangium maewongense]|uniref:Zinc-binding dehydrogenase n=1 Tax=Dactylosporangium maewongense TaxID=634393 RepID=A0ABP4LHY1_9ACTN